MTTRPLYLIAAIAALAPGLAGCVNSPISTAASMRVEVEVYKGPLSKEPELQWADVVGLVEEADQALVVLQTRAMGVAIGAKDQESRRVAETIHQDIGATRELLLQGRVDSRAWNRTFFPSARPLPSLREPRVAIGELAKLSKNGCTDHCDTSTCEPFPKEEKDKPLTDAKMISWLDTCWTKTAEKLKVLQVESKSLEDQLKRTYASKNELQLVAEVSRKRLAIANMTEAMSRLKPNVEDLVLENAVNNAAAKLSSSTTNKLREQLRDILAEIGTAAQRFKLKASLWSEANVPYALSSDDARRLQITFATLLGTYADRMSAKADSLLKQIKGDDRLELPLSVSLRETNPPAYLRQFIWYDAGGDPFMRDLAISREGSTRDRVRGVERLYADENWSNVNTVYASGQGTVRMALIKDDIGNWNLKSFDADPSKVLSAYKDIGLAAVKVATDVAKTVASGGGAAAATQALDIANRFALGAAVGGGPALGNKGIDQLHAETLARLKKVEDETTARRTDLSGQIKDLTDITKEGSVNQAAEDAYRGAVKAKAEAELAGKKADEDAQSNTVLKDGLDKAIAEQTAAANANANAPSAALQELRRQSIAAGDAIKKAKAKKTTEAGNVTIADGAIAKNSGSATQYKADKDKLEAAKRSLAQLPNQALERSRAILEGHQQIIDALESSVVSNEHGSDADLNAALQKQLSVKIK